ncbi:MAG: hypothetical protein U5R46_12530 [Gammaproteobacteria bacterium]|nr:hypothetical protein [Gammaproteobacteria bacterium]
MHDEERNRRLRYELETLEAYCEELVEAIDDFEHQARRCRDRLEREGGLSHGAEAELKRLKQNRELNREELKRSRRRIEELKAELGAPRV